MNKKEFSQFIAQKRLAAGYTQKQLAELLYVDHSTVSKWERGLSYPDITLISKICGLLSISEHEFLTACDDTQARKEKKEARRWRGLKKGFQRAFAGGYLCALIPCFICNLAVDHTLSWFWIVFSALLLGACITNLPFLLAKQSKHTLLFTSLAVTAATFLLLAICSWQTSGDWLLAIAYPVAGLCFGGYFAVLALCRYLPTNWWLKIGLSLLVLAVVLLAGMIWGNPGTGYSWQDYFNLMDWSNTGILANKITFWALLAAGAAGTVIGGIKQVCHGFDRQSK